MRWYPACWHGFWCCSLISTEYVLGVFFSCILLFMLATPGSRVLDECNIACSLNYRAALMRGISQNVDKMNAVPQLLLVYELGEMQQFAWQEIWYAISLFGFSNTSLAALEVFIIVINIFVRKRGYEWHKRLEGVIKRRYCQRWPFRDATVWLMVSFTADKKNRKETQTWEDSAKKSLWGKC